MENEFVPVLQELQTEIQDLTKEVRSDKKYRRLTKILFVSVIFDIILSIVIGVIGIRANDTAHVAAKASSDIVVSCNAGNTFRTQESALWNELITLTAGNPQTEQGKEQLKQFKAYLDQTFTLRDCSQVTK